MAVQVRMLTEPLLLILNISTICITLLPTINGRVPVCGGGGGGGWREGGLGWLTINSRSTDTGTTFATEEVTNTNELLGMAA